MEDKFNPEYVDELKLRIEKLTRSIENHRKWLQTWESEKALAPALRTVPADRLEAHIDYENKSIAGLLNSRHRIAALIGLGHVYPVS